MESLENFKDSLESLGGGQAAMGGYWDIYTITYILWRYAM